MRYQGPLYQWNDEKGYGFVEPNGGGTRAFVHIKEFADQTRRPALGDLLIYRLGQDEQGRPVAREICFVGGETPAHFERVEQFRRNSNQFTLLFCLLLAILTFMGDLPIPVLLLYTGMSLATYLCYLVDKARAMQNGWRIAESTLLLLGLACGWPGALFAQRQLNHKTRKRAFQRSFWATVLANCALLGALMYYLSGHHGWPF